MQFHHNGYVSQNPKDLPAEGVGLDRPSELPEEMDVLIVGSGPAGMIAAAQLSMFPDVHTRIIERRQSRLTLGQADGIQSRSVETFQAFQFAHEITAEAYSLLEMGFWNPDPDNPENIVRTAVTKDDAKGISEYPHLIVNQARVLDYFVRFMEQSPSKMSPDYGWKFLDLEVSENPDEEYPVTVKLQDNRNGEDGPERTVRTKYVVGSDGASSKVRKSIGRQLAGDAANQAWGVLDIVANSNFPDIRTKASIHSTSGSILHIPREGGHLFRLYVDMGEIDEENKGTIRDTPVQEVIDKANAILHPYFVDVKEVAWNSIYEVGHRLVDGFDNLPIGAPETDSPNVFLTGDACHTHSAKAGQGMNVSIQDGFNIGWKLGQVASGRAPKALLRTYHDERQPAAQALIDFDKEWSTLMATPQSELDDPQAVEKYYIDAEEFAAGMLTTYSENLITGDTAHQDLATGFPVGRRFKAHRAMRRADANEIYLGHGHAADGRWRIYAFADQPAPGAESKLSSWAEWMAGDARSPLVRFTPAGGDDNAALDIHAIYQQPHRSFELFDAPEVFFPTVGKLQVRNYENVWAALPEEDIFDGRGISRDGAVVVVRPDQYIAAVLPLDDTAALADFFDGVLVEQN